MLRWSEFCPHFFSFVSSLTSSCWNMELTAETNFAALLLYWVLVLFGNQLVSAIHEGDDLTLCRWDSWGYDCTHSCHVSFDFAAMDRMVTFKVLIVEISVHSQRHACQWLLINLCFVKAAIKETNTSSRVATVVISRDPWFCKHTSNLLEGGWYAVQLFLKCPYA